MTTKQDTQDILGEFSDYGFSLREPDTHILELLFKDKVIARYNQTRVTREILREGCVNFLKNTAGHS